uniref:Uncharacterized protein n=1 Tax=Glycine max TaxID=3847 RepID=A0A0R0I5N0_SOYBN
MWWLVSIGVNLPGVYSPQIFPTTYHFLEPNSSNSGQTYIVPNFRTFLYILLLATCYASTDSLVLGKCSADKEKLVCATFDIELMLSAIKCIN